MTTLKKLQSVALSEEIAQKVKAEATKLQSSQSQVIRLAVSRYFEKQ